MKIACSKSDLLNGVNIAMKAVSNKTAMPILECLLLECDMDTIKMTGNDTELGIETIIDGSILQPGRIALDAKLFSDIVRKLPDSEVVIETNELHQATIRCEKAKFNIPGKAGQDFAILPEVEKNHSISLSQFSLREMIHQTIFSTSNETNNIMMTGELIEIDGNQMKMVSLDGFRISIRTIELKESYDPVKVVVPGKTLNEISKIISGGVEDMMNIYFTDKHVLFEFENTKVVSRLIEGEYYRINQMLSSDYDTKITINKKELMGCLDRALLLRKESDKKPIIVNISNMNLYLKIDSSIGTMDEEIEIQKEGKDLMIGFNPNFIMDSLRAIDDDEVSIYFMNAKSPCVIKNDKESYIYLILPINISA